ncbi:MAG: uroporphyrinogen decarboxylase family protein, partial [Acidobacteriota bacterium]
MNGRQRILAALGGEQPDRTPVMLHNFMMAAREAGFTMRQFREDPQAIARSFILAVEEYEYDGVLVDVDTVTLAGAVGVPIDYPEDAPARASGARLTRIEEVDELEPADIRRHWQVQVWQEAVVLLKRYFGDEVFVRGNCDQAPFSLASAMRGLQEWMLDLAAEEHEELAHKLLEYCADVTMQFLRLMAETGADMVSNGDSPAGPELISPRLYRKFALPYEKRMAECAHGLAKPYALHICGKTDRILEEMVSTGADALELDYKTGARLARDVLRGRAAFIGNLDPSGVLALGTPRLVEEKTRELVAVFAGTPRFIL